jgi:PiT family inorganic phosphate transporter
VLLLVILTIAAVLAFDFTNGFHDASNMLATLVASRAMTPAQAALLVACFTLLGPILGGTAVANTLGGLVTIDMLPATDALTMVLCAVGGAIGWNLLTWRLGIPSSSSHALVGGLAGVVMAGPGSEHMVWGFAELSQGRLTGVAKVLAALLVSPMVGFAAGFLLHRLMNFLLRAARPTVNRHLRHGQWFTAAALAFSHGANDAQKGMGIITLVLVLGGQLPQFQVPLWVMLLSAIVITAGTLLGGWRIVRTLGFGIYKLRPLHGLDAQLASASVIMGASLAGGPVSTTHVVTTAIMGIGASERPRAVRWSIAGEIALTWLLTLPGSALLACMLFGLAKTVFH